MTPLFVPSPRRPALTCRPVPMTAEAGVCSRARNARKVGTEPAQTCVSAGGIVAVEGGGKAPRPMGGGVGWGARGGRAKRTPAAGGLAA